MNATLISAFKRKDVKAIIAELLTQEGKDEQAKEVTDAGRLTIALIDRTCIPSEQVEKPLSIFAEALVVGEKGENILITMHNNIVKALDKGKGKKALKLIKASIEQGVKGAVIEKQMEQAKALKKEGK